MEYTHNITVHWDLPSGLTFVVKFRGGKERVFYLTQQSEGYTYHVLLEDGCDMWYDPLLGMTVTYKTSMITVISKCLKRLEDEFSRFSEKAIKENKIVSV